MATDFYFVYPSLKLAEERAADGGAPLFLYRFAYEADYSVLKAASNLTYSGAGHAEDLTFVFRANYGTRRQGFIAQRSKDGGNYDNVRY